MNDENIHIGALLKQFLIYWRIYVPIGIICFIAAVIFLLVTPKEYEFKARMQLIKNSQGMMSELKMLKSTGLSSAFGGGSAGVSVEDEVIVMMSRTNMTEAIRLTDYQIETRERQGLKNVLLYGKDCPVTFIFPEQFLDTLSQSIKLKIAISNGKIESATIKSDLFNTIKLKDQPLPSRVQLPVGTIIIAPNSTFDANMEKTFTTRISTLQSTYEQLDEDLNISAQETISDIVRLLMNNENKQRGYDFLNSIMASYNQYSRKVRTKEADINAKFVKERLDTVISELAYLEYKIEEYQKQNNIPEPELYAKAAMTSHLELESTIMETEIRLKMLDYVIGYMNNPINKFSSIPNIEEVGEKNIAIYNQMILERQRLILYSEKDNPALILTENQLEEQKKMLLGALTTARHGIHTCLVEMKNNNTSFNNKLHAIPTQEREYIEMKRLQKMKETFFLFLVQKLQEKELANSPDEQAGRVLDAAYCSAKPVFPRKIFVFAIALAAAFVISLLSLSVKVFVLSKTE